MKEIVFLNRNADRWKEFEKLLNTGYNTKPDILSDLYIQITDDLSYSRTYFPSSQTTKYLNSLAMRAHQIIYRNKKENRSRIISFWKSELPLIFRESRKYILYSFIIFFISFLIGVVSTAYDDTFVRLILGDTYVNMTLENIDKGDPLAVYKKANQIDMFLGISVNNIRVSFLAFVLGVFLSLGTGYILFMNGIMLGTFQYFFYQHGLLGESILTIWIHGTLEIFAIIVSGGAGIMLGNSLLFPGTYKRSFSFISRAKKGIKICFGLIPVFLLAATLEGFVTRYTGMPDVLRLFIIISSLILIVWYFFTYPNSLLTKINSNGQTKH